MMWLAFAAALGISAAVAFGFWWLGASRWEQLILGSTLGWAAALGILGNLRDALIGVCLGGLVLTGYYLWRGFSHGRSKT